MFNMNITTYHKIMFFVIILVVLNFICIFELFILRLLLKEKFFLINDKY